MTVEASQAYVPPVVAPEEPQVPPQRTSEYWTEERRAQQAERMRKVAQEHNRQRKDKRKPKAPKEQPQQSGAKLNAELIEIQDRLAQLLALPALGMDMAGDEWPAGHVRQNAGPLAHAIIERARLNPAFRAQLLRVMRISDSGGLYIALFTYLVPIALYYELLPLPPLRAALGVPARSELRVAQAMPGGPNAVTPEEARAEAERIAAMQNEQDRAQDFERQWLQANLSGEQLEGHISEEELQEARRRMAADYAAGST